MTSAEHNDLMPATQEKLEWVTPKILLMDAVCTEGKINKYATESAFKDPNFGPS